KQNCRFSHETSTRNLRSAKGEMEHRGPACGAAVFHQECVDPLATPRTRTSTAINLPRIEPDQDRTTPRNGSDRDPPSSPTCTDLCKRVHLGGTSVNKFLTEMKRSLIPLPCKVRPIDLRPVKIRKMECCSEMDGQMT